MVYSLLWFEIKNRLARLSSVVYFGAFFAISFFLAITFAGAFKGVGFTFGFSSKLALNSPVVLNTIISSMSYFGLMIIAPIFGQSINQDFESGFNQVLFATPIGKPTYFFVRFFGSFLSSLLILLSIGIGVWGATLMPFIDQSMILDNCIWFFMNPYLTTLIPNILTFGAIFLAVASVFKKIAPVYVASISIFTGYMISQNLTGDLDNKLIAALIEPFGVEGASQVIRYWSIAEQSTQVVPLIGNFLYNRVLWGAVGFLALFFGYFSFNPYSFSKERKRTIKPEYSIKCLKLEEIVSTPRSWKVFWQLSLSEFTQVFSNIFFSIILSCGILYILAVSSHIGKLFGTETLPVTYHVLEVITDSFSLFVVAILSYYAGELVWKDREQRVYELIDSKPISDVFLYFSKLISLVLVLLVLIAVILASCVFIQISKSYTHFEWNVYVQKLVIFTLPTWILASILALFIQTISSNKQIGHMWSLLFSCFPGFPHLG
jgi:ABC-2 type transport system permease protein